MNFFYDIVKSSLRRCELFNYDVVNFLRRHEKLYYVVWYRQALDPPTLSKAPTKVCHTFRGLQVSQQLVCTIWNKMATGPIKRKHLASSASPETNQINYKERLRVLYRLRP